MSGNIQNRLTKVRKPRVHITLDVQADGRPRKELPFVIGVLGDFSGDPEVKVKDKNGDPVIKDGKPVVRKVPSFTDRNFVTIDRDNFDKVMERILPGLTFRVDNKLNNDSKEFFVELAFSSMEDFEPAKVAAQVPALKELLETRAKLRDLLAKADRSEELENLLETILQRDDELKKVQQDLGPRKE